MAAANVRRSAPARHEDSRPTASIDLAREKTLTVEVWPDLTSVEQVWRRLESAGGCSPYQRFDWIASYVSTMGRREGVSVCVLSVQHGSGEPLLLLPLAVHRYRGVRIASPIGGKQANYHCPVMAAGAGPALDDGTMTRLLREAGAQAGIDVFAFQNLPLAWRGERNPLVLPGAIPSPSNAPKTALPAKAETLLAQIGTSESRRKLRRKEAGLATLGNLTSFIAQSPGEVDRILDAFFRQKNERLRELGIVSPFEDEASHAFVRAGCLAGLAGGRPAIELHGLALDGEIIATYGGAVDGERFSCMINSFDLSSRFARFSPGDVLLARVIGTQCSLGRTVLDLGIGEARYKSFFCKDVEQLVDVFLPVTGLGKLYRLALEQLSTAKRYVKQTPSLWSLVLALRAKFGQARAGFSRPA